VHFPYYGQRGPGYSVIQSAMMS